VVNGTGAAKWKASIELNGTLSYTVGELYYITSERINKTNQPLRIKEVKHSFTSKGWTTDLTMEEDENIVT